MHPDKVEVDGIEYPLETELDYDTILYIIGDTNGL